MKKISLQWRLTILTTVLITVLCGCLTFFLYKNGVYYIDTLQETVTDQSAAPEAVYIDIPDIISSHRWIINQSTYSFFTHIAFLLKFFVLYK